MADENPPLKFARQSHLRDDAQRARRGIGGFVDMEIEVPAFALGEAEHDVQTFAHAHPDRGRRAENS